MQFTPNVERRSDTIVAMVTSLILPSTNQTLLRQVDDIATVGGESHLLDPKNLSRTAGQDLATLSISILHRDNRVLAMPSVLVWDIETVPDVSGFAAANDLFDKTAEEVREAMATNS